MTRQRRGTSQSSDRTPERDHAEYVVVEPDRLVIELPTRREKRSVEIARAILHDASLNGLGPGALLPSEPEMLATYKVARSTVREALRILEINGLVEMRRGREGGPVVEGPSAREFGRMASLHFQALRCTVADLIATRAIVEPVMARLAALSDDEHGRDRLRAAVHAAADGEASAGFEADVGDFHEAVLRLSGNPPLELWASALLDVVTVRLATRFSPEEMDEVSRDHVAIGTAILERDPVAAERLMREHHDKIATFHRLTPAELARVVEWR